MKQKVHIIIAFFICISSQVKSQGSFTLGSEELCLSEGLTLTNTSVNGSQYSWDFCVGDILGDPTTGNYTISD